MSYYSFNKDKFIVKNYQNAKTFSNFLPAIAGVDGKPLWAFYANVGQVMAGFGVNNKETPITPFDSANLAYMNLSTRSFRTFVRVDNNLYKPFFEPRVQQTLELSKTDITIKDSFDVFDYEVNYTTVPHKNYAGLVRHVTIKNNTSEEKEFEILDGLPIFFPNGLSNFCYKELVSLMAAYCEVENLDNNVPFVKFKTSTSDNSRVEMANSGNAFYSLDEKNNFLKTIVDLRLIFGNDKSLINPLGFINKSYEELCLFNQQQENKLPCAFSLVKVKIKPNSTYSFVSLYGMFDTFDILLNSLKETTYDSLVNMKKENELLIEDLLKPSLIKTSDNLFDEYIKQSFLDNALRGGFPITLSNTDEVYYIYSRKHGDMERDYNAFQIPSRYYSSGQGNFRDVNQNRRSDLYYFPFVKDYNIRLFFSLIQIDGQNPLNVKPLRFEVLKKLDLDIKSPFKEQVDSLLLRSFEPSELYTLLKDNSLYLNSNVDDLFSYIINNSKQVIEANFAEGYWIDHWTYNVDLLENFVSIYPDKIEELLLTNDYKYFYSTVYVEPRSEKYCLINEGKVRQYGAINEKKAHNDAKELNLDLAKTHWLKNKNNEDVYTTLINKIFSLIVIKFSTLDNKQLGIEMECEKPGWNDAMNGLPGLTASALSESIELLRLIRFSLTYFPHLKVNSFKTFVEQFEFYSKVKKYLSLFVENKISSFEYWDKVTSLREDFRKEVHYNILGETKNVEIKDVIETFMLMEKIISKGINEAKKIGNGIIPSYLIHEINDYEELNHINFLGYKTIKAKSFDLVTIPPFLEASARVLKLGKEFYTKEDYKTIKESDLYDKTLHIYKTCADIDDAPFEIGRVHAFTKGWLERECNFLHMTYKYLLGLLKAGYYEEFYNEIKDNFPIYMDVNVYGRNPIENSSFIVPTCNPDSELHGQGYFARLTGANAEVLNMVTNMFLGDKLFTLNENKELEFKVEPKLHASLFANGKVEFTLFSDIKLIYHNVNNINTYDAKKIYYVINGTRYDRVLGKLATEIRNKKIKEINIFIEG